MTDIDRYYPTDRSQKRSKGEIPATNTYIFSGFGNDNEDFEVGSGIPNASQEPIKSNATDIEAFKRVHILTEEIYENESLDNTYRRRDHNDKLFFTPGKIFSTMWTGLYQESTNTSENDQFTSQVSNIIYGGKTNSKIRRFVVVKYKNKCCTCLPVTTYDSRGHKKRGINLNEHGLIYSGDVVPQNIDGIDMEPLRAHVGRGAKELISSFINYGQPCTVQCNAWVRFLSLNIRFYLI